MNLIQLGKHLRLRRRQLGLTVRQVADRIGVSRAYLSILETGRNPRTRKPSQPSLELVIKLSKALQLDLAPLVSLAGYSSDVVQSLHPKSTSTDRDREILRGLAHKIEDLHNEVRGVGYDLPQPSPERVPSGIPGFRINAEDHILLLSEADAEWDIELSFRFVAGGLTSGETGILRLPPAISPNQAQRTLKDRLHTKHLDRLVLVPWNEGVVPHYGDHFFTREATIRAHSQDIAKANARGGSLIRFATPDTSDYFRWVRNPKDVLKYESLWQSDLHSIDPGRQFVLLCLYRLRDMEKQARPGLPLEEMILNLLESHNRVLYHTSRQRLLFDAEAVRNILGRMDFRDHRLAFWNRINSVCAKHGVWASNR